MSLGTDTGGSIRSPAAACGVAGLKPTYGRVSRRGIVPNCFSHDHAGPLAWTSRDLALIMTVIAGHDPRDPGSAAREVPDYVAALTGNVEGLVIGVPWRWLEDELPPSPATRAAFDAALGVFRALGAVVREVSLPPIREYHATMKVIAVSELFAIHAKDLRSRPELFGESLRYRIIAGGLVRAEEYLLAQRARTDLARAMQDAMAKVDVIMLPTSEPAERLQPEHPASTFTNRATPPPSALRATRRCPSAAASTRRACRSLCRSSAGCSMRRRCCGPATPTSALRHGGNAGRRCAARRLAASRVRRLKHRRRDWGGRRGRWTPRKLPKGLFRPPIQRLPSRT